MPAPPPLTHPVASPEPVELCEIDVDLDDERSRTRFRAVNPETPEDEDSEDSEGASEGGDAPLSSGPTSSIDTYHVGDVIAGKYRLKNVIGRGGMGSVWLAHNLALDIEVAIKLIRRDRAVAGAPGRLLQEARSAARLRHPVIVRVFDFGETQRGDPFIVMELLHGESLSAVIARKGRLSPPIAVQTLLPVASALVEAHSKGIVHRDLKPDNILLVKGDSGELTPKVVDFGIAKVMNLDVERQLTMAGEVLGSPDYMSPEQARGDEDVGEGTDVWALSVVLYEAITGKRPFDGPNYNALIAAILMASPIPAGELSDCDGDLWSVLARGLDKTASERWPTMKDFGSALAAWALERGIEDDITGASIAKQWIVGGKSKHLITVFTERESAPIPGHPSFALPVSAGNPATLDRPSSMESHSAPEKLSSLERGPVPATPSSSAPYADSSADWGVPTRPRPRARWIALAAALAALGLIGAFAALGLIGALAAIVLPSSPPAPGPTGSGILAVSSVVAAAPSALVSSAVSTSPSPEVKPSSAVATGSARPPTNAKQPRKTTAPKVPKHINF